MADEATDLFDVESSFGRKRSFLIWPVLLAAGWLLYELTAQPDLGAVFVCAKFGWEDFRTALWLGRVDDNRRRAHAYFWLYAASALWKTALTAFLVMFAFALVGGFQGAARNKMEVDPRLPPWFGAVLWTAWIGFGMSIVTTAIAFGLARINGVKLWLSPALHQARRAKTWPPRDFFFGRANFANYLLIGALFLVGVICFSAIGVMLVITVMQGRGTPWVIAAFLAFLVMAPVSLVAILDKLSKGLTAVSPRECWTPEEFDMLAVRAEESRFA
jgi:hypothetical protein